MGFVRDKYQNAIRPIYGCDERGRLKLSGSCVLLKIDDAPFFLLRGILQTIANTLHYIQRDITEEECTPITFDEAITTNPDVRRSDDPYDFSLIKIPDRMEQKLQGVSYVGEQEIRKHPYYTEGHVFMAFGFPCSKNNGKAINKYTKEIKGTMWSYSSTSVTTEEVANALGKSGRRSPSDFF